MPNRPTPLQLEILKSIGRSVESLGYQPLFAELAQAAGCSSDDVLQNLQELQSKGLVEVVGERAVRIIGMKFRAEAEKN